MATDDPQTRIQKTAVAMLLRNLLNVAGGRTPDQRETEVIRTVDGIFAMLGRSGGKDMGWVFREVEQHTCGRPLLHDQKIQWGDIWVCDVCQKCFVVRSEQRDGKYWVELTPEELERELSVRRTKYGAQTVVHQPATAPVSSSVHVTSTIPKSAIRRQEPR